MKIFSNSEILKSSGQQTIVLIENQPVHLGCFYERSHMPANVKYEYTWVIRIYFLNIIQTDTINPIIITITIIIIVVLALTVLATTEQKYRLSIDNVLPYFIQSKSYIPEEKLGSLQAIGWKSFKNASLLYYQSQQNLVEFLPDRIFNGAKVNCQIRGTRFKSVQADRNILITSNQSMVLSDMEDRRNETSEETLEVTSSQSSIDLNIHYGPDIHNPEDQFYPVYLCTKFNQGSQTSCGNKVTSPWTTSQNIILQCRTDFNPPGQVQWFQWQPSRRSLVYITNGQTLQFNIEQLKDLLKYTEITSHNLWFIDNYFSKNKEVIPVVGEELIFKLWKFICIASSDGFTNQSANRYVVEASKFCFVVQHIHVFYNFSTHRTYSVLTRILSFNVDQETKMIIWHIPFLYRRQLLYPVIMVTSPKIGLNTPAFELIASFNP
ncbi:unnamed protein product [Trichobilharzia regenti]|nr:unnamed protein product [Trichobilharzia regenti]